MFTWLKKFDLNVDVYLQLNASYFSKINKWMNIYLKERLSILETTYCAFIKSVHGLLTYMHF